MDRHFCKFGFKIKMGKKHRLNRFISKWIKSDLPEDRSTVLLLGVTRIPTSPSPARRPCSLPIAPNLPESAPNPAQRSSAQTRRSSFSTRRHQVARRSSSAKRRNDPSDASGRCVGESPVDVIVTPSNTSGNDRAGSGGAVVMDRSVDSIGTCSLDVDASAELSDWSEASSVGTLRSASLKTPSTPKSEHHLPSYLSLACTVNGYSTTTNYDPVRLARSRDNSPHRLDHDNLTPKNYPTYSIQNNLLSPPNLVPLPTHIKPPKMSDHTITQHNHNHRQFYSTTKTSSAQFSNFKDTVDACLENGHSKAHVISYESKSFSSNINGQNKCSSETTIKEFSSNTTETKSFIQQRVERLYGPGALAQGFFVMKKRQSDKDDSFTSEHEEGNVGEKIRNGESPMKQSSSSPALPVLRHLRPEFRAQLPIISPKKGSDGAMQKSSTVPELKQETKVNGHSKQLQVAASEGQNLAQITITEEAGEKDGHYFIKILQNEANRLLKLADDVETELVDEGLNEEVIGKIRSASGKARLLVSQKMQQFKGLCTNNITQSEGEAFPTTNEDLQGFWDMVMLQVDQVDALFKEIDALKANNWQEVKTETKTNKISANGKSRKAAPARVRPTSAASEEARKLREAQRKQMIEERRKAMKAQSKPVESIEIFVPESS